MSRAALQEMASDIVDAFVDADMADAGTYTAPGGSPVPCRVIISRARSPFGSYGSVARNQDTITLLLAEVPSPRRGAMVVADGQTFKLVQMVTENAAATTWDVE